LTVIEPRAQANVIHPPQRMDRKLPSIAEVLRALWSQPASRHLTIAIVLLSTMSLGLAPWYAAFMMRSHGMTTGTLQRLSSGKTSYDVTMLGYNYRMDELRAAIGLVQIKNLDSWNEQRGALTQAYRMKLAAHCSSVLVPFSQPRDSVYHILPVVLPKGTDRKCVSEKLRTAGIQTTVHYPPVHEFSWYRRRSPSIRLPLTEEFARRELTLPLHPRLGESELEFVVRALSNALAPGSLHDDLDSPSAAAAASIRGP